MHDDLFTKRILDYLQRIIYNGRQNVSRLKITLAICLEFQLIKKQY